MAEEVKSNTMSLEWHETQGVAVVKVPKELDITVSDNFKREVVKELFEKKRSCIILDFGDCEYIDSSGLGVVISIYKRSLMEGGTTILARLNNDVKKVLTITSLDKVLRIKDTIEEALEEAIS